MSEILYLLFLLEKNLGCFIRLFPYGYREGKSFVCDDANGCNVSPEFNDVATSAVCYCDIDRKDTLFKSRVYFD